MFLDSWYILATCWNLLSRCDDFQIFFLDNFGVFFFKELKVNIFLLNYNIYQKLLNYSKCRFETKDNFNLIS
jgi:hypothetical protein